MTDENTEIAKFPRSASISIVGGSVFVGSSLAAHIANKFDVSILDLVHRKTSTDNSRNAISATRLR
jgi:nucleoside-diphosphate-sugar epimerase